MAKHYESDGLQYDPGEIPQCSYCNRKITDPGVSGIYETALSGIICCTDPGCMEQLLLEGDEITLVD